MSTSESNFLRTVIKENNIESYVFGVILMNDMKSYSLEVADNTIYTWGSPSGFNQAGIVTNDMGETLSPDGSSLNYLVNCNTISGNFLHGIKVTGNNEGGWFYHNTVNMANDNMHTGMGFYNCEFPRIDNNIVC